jgi:hypothetical protein
MVVRAVFFAIVFFLVGAVASWSACLFLLHLPWETSLTVIEIFSLLCAIFGGVYFRKRKLPSD